eukprot:TRINITY_DN1952_c0_g1_i1.p1 TRINITY_DN1952_c0_g1~~TRINITY_DN1952_c0_g1_i1.p1  ORF type:complete len:408 (+),score=116.00 TRINITY_DN1952_c0_g1_i1:91-1314(+)
MNILLGVIYALVAAVCSGSYTVFLKTPSVMKANVDSLVTQIYLSVAVLVTSPIYLSIEEFKFSWLGMLTGALYTSQSVFSIIAVKNAGISVSSGLWVGFTLATSFLVGSVFFHEQFDSMLVAIIALLVMCVGVIGCGTCQVSLSSSSSTTGGKHKHALETDAAGNVLVSVTDSGLHERKISTTSSVSSSPPPPILSPINSSVSSSGVTATTSPSMTASICLPNQKGDQSDSLLVSSPAPSMESVSSSSSGSGRKQMSVFMVGIICAILTGITNGSYSVPTHWVYDHKKTFMISFALSMFICSVACHYARLMFGHSLPSFQWRVAAVPSLISGILLAGCCLGQISAVEELGQALGMSLAQCSLLVGGIWAILYYKEITGARSIAQWTLSAFLIMSGAVLLASQKKSDD